MFKRFFTPPQQSYFLFGPRGTGKSTWLRQYYKNAYWIDLLDPELFRIFSTTPERLGQILAQNIAYKTVVIDEIQKVPELLNVIHHLIEMKQGYQFIMAGSSTRKLKKQGINLLGGRALLRHMPPFFAAELGEAFNLSQNLKLGMLPIVLDSQTPREVLRAYVGVYLKEEVQAEGIVRNVGDFARFLETMSFSQASLINASNIARECQIARKTVDGYLLILEDLLLAFHLPVFRLKVKRAVISHPKFYFFDVGVYNSLCPKNYGEHDDEKDGVALEGLVAQHLKSWVDAQTDTHQLYFWRTSSNVEVDFIVYGPSSFLAIEVKNGTTIHPTDIRGLKAFQEDYPKAKLLLLYRGKQKFKQENVICYPVDEFLIQIHPQASLPVD